MDFPFTSMPKFDHRDTNRIQKMKGEPDQSMRMLIVAMFKKVPVCQTKRLATLCKRCGAAIYSLSFLKAHLDAHNKKTQ